MPFPEGGMTVDYDLPDFRQSLHTVGAHSRRSLAFSKLLKGVLLGSQKPTPMAVNEAALLSWISPKPPDNNGVAFYGLEAHGIVDPLSRGQVLRLTGYAELAA